MISQEREVHVEHKCKICSSSKSKLVVDHNHTTGEVRGLLCPACKAAIGLLEDDMILAHHASAYLGGRV